MDVLGVWRERDVEGMTQVFISILWTGVRRPHCN